MFSKQILGKIKGSTVLEINLFAVRAALSVRFYVIYAVAI